MVSRYLRRLGSVQRGAYKVGSGASRGKPSRTGGVESGVGVVRTLSWATNHPYRRSSMKSFLAAVVAVLVWFLVWDNFLADMLIGSAMAQLPGLVANMSRFWGAVGDLCGAVMLVGVYGRTRSVWGVGAKAEAMYGVYAGL